mmetsp:Transcript_78676/g.108984  ORF Transcript_78676/g.108984 Transcript_78676/m.108984 type:complete len:204 (+) Transcript_78676:191-802(+)
MRVWGITHAIASRWSARLRRARLQQRGRHDVAHTMSEAVTPRTPCPRVDPARPLFADNMRISQTSFLYLHPSLAPSRPCHLHARPLSSAMPLPTSVAPVSSLFSRQMYDKARLGVCIDANLGGVLDRIFRKHDRAHLHALALGAVERIRCPLQKVRVCLVAHAAQVEKEYGGRGGSGLNCNARGPDLFDARVHRVVVPLPPCT